MQTAARREQFTPSTAHTPKSIFQRTDLFPVFVTLHPGTMLKMNLPELTLCLLGTVLLCGATTVEPPSTITSGPTTPAVTSNKPTTPAGTSNKPTTPAGTSNKPTTAAGTTVSSSGDTATTGTVTDNPTSSTGTTESVGDSSSGLSSGAIAGITIGSIAGVAAVGGGIFGALKYTARI